MTWTHLVKAELRKLTTTKLPWGFLAALVVVTPSTPPWSPSAPTWTAARRSSLPGADQVSLMAFAFNAMLGTALFGAIAVAREYGHTTG